MSADSLQAPEYTSRDIDLCSVYIRLKDGTPIVATVEDPAALGVIVSLCQFVKLPPDSLSNITIKELCQSE